MLFAVLVPASLGIFISARKITGQSYIQHQAASTLGEINDIVRYLRNQDFDFLENGEFFLIRNPGGSNWLVKSDLPDKDIFERYIEVSDARRHEDTNDLFFEGDIGAFYEDPYTKKIDIRVLWSPDYLPLDIISHTIYITDWQQPIVY